MKTLSSVRVNIWLPLFFAVSYLLVILLVFSLEYWHGLGEFQERIQDQVRQLAMQSALPIRHVMENPLDAHDIPVLFGSLSILNELDAIVLTDLERKIIYSNHYAWHGIDLEEAIPEATQIQGNDFNAIELIRSTKGYLGAMPIEYSLPGSGIRDSHRVILWIYLNTQRGASLILHNAINHAAWVLFLGLIILFGMIWSIYRYIGSPLIQITEFTRQLAAGRYSARLSVKGRGEVTDLVHGLHQMAGNVEQAIAEARASEGRLAITLDSIGDAVVVTDTQGLVTRLNPEAEKLTGWTEDEAIDHPIIEVLHIVNSENREPTEYPVGRVLREERVVSLATHTTLIAKNGREYQIADSAAPIRGDEGEILGIIMVFQDVTERYNLQNRLSNTLIRLKALTEALPDPCFVLSEQGVYLDVLGSADDLLIKSREHCIGRNLSEVLPAETAEAMQETIQQTIATGLPQTLEYRLELPMGEIHFEGHTTKFERAGGPAVIWLARDITSRKEAEESISRLAKYDPLTGLPNRRLLEHRLEQAIARCQRNDNHGALLFIDLDHFKNINDSLGHFHGDQLLIHIAERLRHFIRTEDLAARFGGDEFVILLEDLGQDLFNASQHAESVAIKLSDACSIPMELAKQIMEVELSIGIVIFPDDADAHELIKRADIAMYQAKESGRNQACFFSRDLQEVADERLNIQHALRKAIHTSQFQLYVQPRVNSQGEWIGGEVLVRWPHPERGMILPNAFIPVAEESGLISALDSWVISHAIQALAEESSRLPDDFRNLSLNLTEPLMMRTRFIDELKSWFSQAALEPKQIEFEITERVLLSDYTRASVMIEQLRDLGLRFSVDDFGTGCSSLRYLQRLPLDALKIDKLFIDRLPGHQGDASIVETIIDMAGHLSLEVIAEGVENKTQQDFLIERGCELFQGYLFARPMPWDEFFQELPKKQADPTY